MYRSGLIRAPWLRASSVTSAGNRKFRSNNEASKWCRLLRDSCRPARILQLQTAKRNNAIIPQARQRDQRGPQLYLEITFPMSEARPQPWRRKKSSLLAAKPIWDSRNRIIRLVAARFHVLMPRAVRLEPTLYAIGRCSGTCRAKMKR